jgi:hypothetical protein
MYFVADGLLLIFLFSGGILVQSVQEIRSMLAKIFLGFRCTFWVFRKIPLKLMAAMLVPPLLEGSF